MLQIEENQAEHIQSPFWKTKMGLISPHPHGYSRDYRPDQIGQGPPILEESAEERAERFVVMHLHTTGLPPREGEPREIPEITQLSVCVINLNRREITQEYQVETNPRGTEIQPRAAEIHGLTTEDLHHNPHFMDNENILSLEMICGGSIIFGQRAGQFIYPVIRAIAEQEEEPIPDYLRKDLFLDTRILAEIRFPDDIPNNGLLDTARRCELENVPEENINVSSLEKSRLLARILLSDAMSSHVSKQSILDRCRITGN